ncbi:MAG: hypothetical protein QM757_34100 [Paludibaculum sp.]
MADQILPGRARLLVTTSLLFGLGTAAAAADTQAIGEALGLDVSAEYIVEYCRDHGAPNAAALDSTWRAWRKAQSIDALQGQLDAGTRDRMLKGFQSLRPTVREQMRNAGQPAAACRSAANLWESPQYDLRGSHPELYAGSSATRAPPAAAAPVASSPAAANATVEAGSGTYYTPAQIRALTASWRAAGSYADAKQAMRAHGPVYVQGKVVRRGDNLYLVSEDGPFISRTLVNPRLELAPYEGRTITVVGELDDLPGSMMRLLRPRIVSDTSRLKPSTLDSRGGMRRADVDPERIIASPGNGIRPDQIFGVLHHGYGATGASGYEFREEARLLLKDGSAYFGKRLAPESVDKDKSRQLEPQQWGQWRKAGDGFELRRQDDYGQPGQWERAEGKLLPRWRDGQRLDATYTTQSFSGSALLGGTYSRSSIVFRPDGSFERIGYSQSSSGTLAQNSANFSSNAASHSDGSGSSSTASGGINGGSGSSNIAVTNRSSKDGSGNRGTYVLSDYGLQLRYDNGRVENLLCAAWNTEMKNLLIGGVTYSR